MTIQYAPNAAAISWLALSQALDSRANMEGSLFSLFASNTKLSMNAAKSQADNAQAAMDAYSKQMITQGVAGLVGATASIAATGFCMYKENVNGTLANNTEQTQTTEFEAQQKLPAPQNLSDVTTPATGTGGSGQITASSTESTSSSVSTQTTTSSDAPSARVTASNRTATSTTNDEAAKTKENQTDENSAKQKNYIRNMDYWAQNSSQFSQILNSVFKDGIGNIVQSGFITAQGKAQAAQTLAQGLSTVFNNQNSMLSSALSSCDSYIQNTNGTISAIIQTSAARG